MHSNFLGLDILCEFYYLTAMKQNNVLLINPWIYDFAAYDFWNKPVGLLAIGNTLSRNGFSTYLIDCLDRYQLPPLLQNSKKYATGKFIRTPAPKPQVLSHIQRHYCRYGMPLKFFLRKLNSIPTPQVVMITSGMTYWYEGPFFAIRIIRKKFPEVPIVLGGIYATLCYDHADRYSGADYVIKGKGEEAALKLASLLTGHRGAATETITTIPSVSYHYYPVLKSVPILTSVGCPFRCPFCASHLLFNKFSQRDPSEVVDDIHQYHSKRSVRHFDFFDDALLINQERHLSVILDGLKRLNVRAAFHTPNGIHPREMTPDLARQMAETNFQTIRLSFESTSISRQNEMGHKVTDDALANSVDYLEAAGYARKDLGVYVIMGLPGQTVDEVVESMLFVHGLGAKIYLSSFSPIPGTRDWEKAMSLYNLPDTLDPLLTNNTIYPLHRNDFTYGAFEALRNFSKVLNYSLDQKINLVASTEISRIIRKQFARDKDHVQWESSD